MAKGFLQGLYDAAYGGLDENTGLAKFDEDKLRRELEKNDRLLKNNKDIFEQCESKTFTCPRYNPCPICSKCQNKASHLYVACQTCRIPIRSHSYEDRNKMIKRKNFVQYVSPEIMKGIRELDKEITGEEYADE